MTFFHKPIQLLVFGVANCHELDLRQARGCCTYALGGGPKEPTVSEQGTTAQGRHAGQGHQQPSHMQPILTWPASASSMLHAHSCSQMRKDPARQTHVHTRKYASTHHLWPGSAAGTQKQQMLSRRLQRKRYEMHCQQPTQQPPGIAGST